MEDRENSNCVEFKGSLYSKFFLLLALLLSCIQDGELYDWVAKASFTNANSKAFSDFPGREQHFHACASAMLCATLCLGLNHFFLVLRVAGLCSTLGLLKPDPAEIYLYSM